MQNQLMFRAWDKKEKEWLFGYGYKSLGGFSLIGEVVLLGELNSIRLEKLLDDIVITQFIGLRDKNRKDAYDGDIFKDDTGKIRTIFYSAGGFNFESNPIAFGYGYQNNSNPSEPLSDQQNASWFESNCEIIGNIFENPELINNQK